MTTTSNSTSPPGGTAAAARLPDKLLAILDRLACARCRGELHRNGAGLHCHPCGVNYPIAQDVIDLRAPEAASKSETADWSAHWAADKQNSLSQRFFSLYRKAVFSRTVRYFVDAYLPSGVLVEAGSGTSETSMRINKHDRRRTLVAVDIVPPVLSRCHPIMDVRVCGDIFRLPFRDASLDGIWNVGVMEHFRHEEIDRILQEFRRVLRPGARVILLWPGTDSAPQRILRAIEGLVNRNASGPLFRFHPDEISQLRSAREGREVLARNGFHPVHVDKGLRSLLAFKTLVGEKKKTVLSKAAPGVAS